MWAIYKIFCTILKSIPFIKGRTCYICFEDTNMLNFSKICSKTSVFDLNGKVFVNFCNLLENNKYYMFDCKCDICLHSECMNLWLHHKKVCPICSTPLLLLLFDNNKIIKIRISILKIDIDLDIDYKYICLILLILVELFIVTLLIYCNLYLIYCFIVSSFPILFRTLFEIYSYNCDNMNMINMINIISESPKLL